MIIMRKGMAIFLAFMLCMGMIACAGDAPPIPPTDETVGYTSDTTILTELEITDTTENTTATEDTTENIPEESTPAEEETTAPLEPEPEPEPLLAGFAERDFTPKVMGGAMPGGSYLATATKVEMPLFANAAAFESDGVPLILLSIDIVFLQEEDCAGIRERITEATGVPAENIMIVATHTHTSVGLNFQYNQTPPNLEAFNHAVDMSVEAAIEAWNTRSRAKMGFGVTELVGYSFCREAHMKNGDVKTWPSRSQIDKLISEVDTSVNVIRVDDPDGNIKCFVVNYANHEDTSSKGGYNSDYPGYMRQMIKDYYGDDVVVLFFNGAIGDVNHVDYLNGGTTDGRNNKTIGVALGSAVIRLSMMMDVKEEYPVIASLSQKYDVPQRVPTAEEFAWAEETLKKIANGEKVNSLDKKYAREYTTYDYSKMGDTHAVEIHTIVIGEFAMVGMPYQPYSELGWRIREASPYKTTFVVSLANGSTGYIGPDFIFGTSSYGARYSYYTSRSGPGTADILVNRSVEMLKKIQTATAD